MDPKIQLPPPPFNRRDDTREVLHGVEVLDPYRWLEDADSAETRSWLEAQQEYVEQYFAGTERERIRARLSKLMRIEEVGIPIERNGYYFFSRRGAGQERTIICRRGGIDAGDEVLLDPSAISSESTVGIEISAITLDGAILAYSVRRGGEDEAEIRIMEVDSHRTIDVLPRARQGLLSWKHDNSGFFYSARIDGKWRLRFHQLETPSSNDRELFATAADEWIEGRVSHDGRYLLVHLWRGSAGDRTEIYVQTLEPEGTVQRIVWDRDARFLATIADNALIMATDWNAPNYRVLRAELSDLAVESWREIIPERAECLQGIRAIGGKLVISYLENALSRIYVFQPDGAPLGELNLPTLGSIAEVSGRWERSEVFLRFQTFNRSPAVYRYNLETDARDLWSRQLADVDPDRFEIRQVWYSSRDGTKIPMFLFHRRGLDLDGCRPTMLYGYGGFNESNTPFYFPPAVLWAETGGVFASANLRGGGEFGRNWHKAGNLDKKQNVFDDFLGAAKWLFENGYSNPAKLAILGGSNGGLLVGAAMTQRPELFRAVLCIRPLLDMIRYHKFSIAAVWVPEYGSADNPDQFRYLIKYSPYHNVRSGLRYPAILLVTGDSDTRVDPLHARKMTGALQTAMGATGRVLLSYRSEAGHSGAARLDTIIDELTDETAFLCKELDASIA